MLNEPRLVSRASWPKPALSTCTSKSERSVRPAIVAICATPGPVIPPPESFSRLRFGSVNSSGTSALVTDTRSLARSTPISFPSLVELELSAQRLDAADGVGRRLRLGGRQRRHEDKPRQN